MDEEITFTEGILPVTSSAQVATSLFPVLFVSGMVVVLLLALFTKFLRQELH